MYQMTGALTPTLAAQTNAPAYSQQDIISIIESVAQKYGVDPLLALATAIQESGLNPNNVGDNGSSFGLFMLHKGGELGTLTPAQAFDPYTNANVAISEISQVELSHPGWSPGQIAAAAQRPLDKYAYANSVNSIYSSLTKGRIPVGGSTPPANGGCKTTWFGPIYKVTCPGSTSNQQMQSAVNAAQNPTPWYITIIQQLFSAANLGPLMIGGLLCAIGMALVLSDHSDEIVAAVKTAAKTAPEAMA